MIYTKHKFDKYNLHIIKTDKFKKVTIKINFKRPVKKEDITIRRLLARTLIESSKKYPNRRALEIETEELYSLGVGVDTYFSGTNDVLVFSSNFLNEFYTEPGMYKRSIDFLLQLILNPNVKNEQFDKEGFDLAMRLAKDEINSFSDYPSSYSVARMYEIMDKNSPLSYRSCGYLKDLKKIDEKSLYKYYLDVLENDIVDIFIVGNIDENETIKIFEEQFFRTGNNKPGISHFLENVKTRNKIIEKKEQQKINQSSLVIGCNLKNITEFERKYVLYVLSFILGGSGDSLLFKTVREKHSLCYSIYSRHNMLSGILTIGAGIDAKNYDKTVNLIKEAIDQLKNGEFEENEINKAQMIYKSSCIEIEDSQNAIINIYTSHEYLNSDLIEDKMKNIELVTKDMVVSLAQKISINTIYMLEGVQDED